MYITNNPMYIVMCLVGRNVLHTYRAIELYIYLEGQLPSKSEAKNGGYGDLFGRQFQAPTWSPWMSVSELSAES